MRIKSPYLQTKLLIPVFMEIALMIYLISALQMAPPLVDGLLSESSFPLLIFLIATPAAVKIFMGNLKLIKLEQGTSEQKEQGEVKKRSIKPLLTILVIATFISLFHLLGFTILAPVYVFFLMLIFDDKPHKIGTKIIYSVIITLVVYILYVVLFDIRFPEIWR